MRVLALGSCLIAFAAIASQTSDAQTARELYRARMNENVVTIMAGTANGTDLRIANEIAQVLDDGDNLRVLPMVGKGVSQNVKDVLFLRGVDMGITQANVLKHFAQTGELGSNFLNQITYVAKLFNEEIHVITRSDVGGVEELEGQLVNFGEVGSGTDITARMLLDALGVHVREVHFDDAEGIVKLKSGEIAAAIVMGGKPAPLLSNLKDTAGLKLLEIPYLKELESDYYPATLTHDDYPQLVKAGENIDTVAVCAVLISFNWQRDSVRYKRLAKFVDAFFSKFDELQKVPRHPKWREVNFAATLENLNRSPVAQAWIDRRTAQPQTSSKESFDAFLAVAAEESQPVSKGRREELFKAFLEWSKRQGRSGDDSVN